MADQWLLKSETYDNCNCAVNCGCQFNLPSTHGYCQSAFVGHLVEGHFNDTPLAWLNWAALYKWPGEIAEGNGKRQIVIDRRADDAQRVALETIVSGGACQPFSNFFSVFASTCSEFCETLFLPIGLEANLELRTARVEIRKKLLLIWVRDGPLRRSRVDCESESEYNVRNAFDSNPTVRAVLVKNRSTWPEAVGIEKDTKWPRRDPW